MAIGIFEQRNNAELKQRVEYASHRVEIALCDVFPLIVIVIVKANPKARFIHAVSIGDDLS